jgi:hypothetical protein
MRLCESMNMHAASIKAHVVLAHRSGDVTVLSWTKICHIPSMKSRNNDKSTTSGPASLLESIHLAPVPSAVMENDKHQRHVEKQISPDLKSGEKTKPPT